MGSLRLFVVALYARILFAVVFVIFVVAFFPLFFVVFFIQRISRFVDLLRIRYNENFFYPWG
jgi:hypothetical protein